MFAESPFSSNLATKIVDAQFWIFPSIQIHIVKRIRKNSAMDSRLILQDLLQRLREHTDLPVLQPQKGTSGAGVGNGLAAQSLPLPTPSTSRYVSAAMKDEIIGHRRIQTTTSRVVEMEVREVISNHPLPAVAVRLLLENLHRFFACVEQRLLEELPSEIDLPEFQKLCREGNARQQFQRIRDLIGPFRVLLRKLAEADRPMKKSMLQGFGDSGILNPNKVNRVVTTAAFGDTEEILSPPEDLRKIWKPVGKVRLAANEGGPSRKNTRALWQTNRRVRDVWYPPISTFELETIFGEGATLISHGDERLPYESGANRFTLAGGQSFVRDCTTRGLFMTSGPSGTAYRYLNLWLVLGGSREKLAELRFAMAAILLGDEHHSLVEVMAVCAPLLDQQMSNDLEDISEQLVPRTLSLEWEGRSQSISPEAFQGSLSRCLKDRVA